MSYDEITVGGTVKTMVALVVTVGATVKTRVALVVTVGGD